MNIGAKRWICAVVLMLTPAVTAADEADLSRQVAEIGRSLDGISRTMDALLLHRRVEVAIRRIELAERRLQPLAGRVDEERRWIEGLDREIAELRISQERIVANRERQLREGQAPHPDDGRMLEEIAGRTRQLGEELSTHRARELELSAEYERERRRIAVLDERLEELFDTLD